MFAVRGLAKQLVAAANEVLLLLLLARGQAYDCSYDSYGMVVGRWATFDIALPAPFLPNLHQQRIILSGSCRAHDPWSG